MKTKELALIIVVVVATCAYFFYSLQSLFDLGEPVDYSKMTVKETTITDTKVGTGKELNEKSKFLFHHNTWIYDPNTEDKKGKNIGSSYERDAAVAASFGDGTLMPRWEKFFVGMKEGGIRRMILSPKSLDQKQKLIFMFPKKHWIILDVELLEVK